MTKKEYNFVMNILIYDNNPNDLSKLCAMLDALPKEFFVDKVSKYEDGVSLYQKNSYDVVFIDIADDIGKKLLDFILENNPTQKVIILSQNDICSDSFGCDHCRSNYNKYRVLKPILQHDLVKVLTNKVECDMYCKNHLLLNLSLIDKNFSTIVFDKENYIFKSNSENYHKNNREIIELTYLLSEKDIPHEITANGIKVLI